MANRIKGITVEIGGNTTGLDKALSNVNKNIKNTETQLKDVNRLLKLDPKNTELLAQKQRLLGNEISDVESKLNALKSAQQQAKKQLESGDLGRDKYEALQREIIATEQKLDSLKSESSKTSSSMSGDLKKVGESAKNADDKLSSINDAVQSEAAMSAVDNLTQITDVLKDLGNEAIDAGKSYSDATSSLQANLGLTEEQTKELGNVVDEVFAKGITDSINEATQAVQLVKQNFEELNDTDLTNVSSKVLSISKKTETDLNDNIRAASKLMDEFEISANEALDLIAAGYQNNLNKSGDFTDTIDQYSSHFKSAGYTADEFFQILSNGMDNGAENTDRVADAVKELQIRLGDGSFEENLGYFSKSTKDVFNEWKNGKATVSDVATSIGNDLKNMTPTEQQTALSVLSTQFEDLGIDASVSLFNIGDAFTDVQGKADQFAQASPAEEWQGSLNEVQTALAEFGTKLLEIFQPILDFVAQFVEGFNSLPEPVQQFIIVAGTLLVIIGMLIPIIISLAAAVTSLNVSLLPIIAIVLAVIAVIALIVVVIMNWGDIVDWLKEKFQAFGDKIKETWDKIKEWFKNGVQDIKDKITGMIDDVKEFFTSLPSKAKEWGKDFIQGLIDGIKDMVGKVQDAVSGVAEKIKEFLHFSRPDVGPLREYEKWMPDFMNGLANGIYDNIPLLTKAANAAASALNYSFMAESPTTSPIDYNSVYKAVRAGTADQSSTIVVDGRVLGRTLKGMGVAFT